MSMADLVQLIGTVGFPICACICMGWYVNKLENRNKADMDRLADIIKNNTEVMTTLVNRIESKMKDEV